MSSLDYLDLCRLCLVKDQVSVSIFDDGESKSRHIYPKIVACLSVKVDPEDKLPKKICDGCAYKLDLFYDFYNTTATAEKQLWMWLEGIGLEDKQNYIANDMNSSLMKQEQGENRLNVAQASAEHQNMSLNMIDNMGLTMPIIMSPDQAISVPISSSETVQTVQSIAGPSLQSQMARKEREDDEETTEDDNTEDEIDHDEGLPVKEEHEDGRIIEPTTFVNVTAMACDEAGPSGLQQKLPEMTMQAADVDPKSGYYVSKLAMLSQDHVDEMKVLCEEASEVVITDRDLEVPKHDGMEIIVPAQSFVQCVLCGDGFICDEELAEHLKTHEHPQPTDQTPEEEGQVLIESTDLDDEKVVYVCEHCGRNFPTIGLLRKHQQQVHNQNSPEKIFTCELCGYTTPHKQNFTNHQRRHNLEYKYHCETCGAGFYARNIYQEHQLVHSREKPFQCEVCNATFRYRQGLRLHAKLHQPDYVPPQKKHLCELCNKRFSRKQVLLVHMRTHGNAGPQSEFVCHICGKSVSSKTYLTVHVRKHTGEKPHVCDLCGKGFISQNYLSVHRRTHTGERPHQCTHCEKRFTQRTTLVVHLRGHTGDRPYPCTFCHKSFASKTMLNSHLKTHAKQTARAQLEQEQLLKSELTMDQGDLEEITDDLQDSMQVEVLNEELHDDELDDQSHVRSLEPSELLPG